MSASPLTCSCVDAPSCAHLNRLRPIADAPRDGTPVAALAFAAPEGGMRRFRELHAFMRIGKRHGRWYRLRDMAEVSALPVAFQPFNSE